MNVKKIRKDFPILERKINGKKLIYFDNAATSQKPKEVIDAICHYYKNHNANVHRGIHTLSDEATQLYEESRKTVAEFIGAKSPEELVFTKGTTDGLNALAISLESLLEPEDEIITTVAEHHSNFLPWQRLAEKTGANLIILEMDNEGSFPLKDFKKALSGKTKIVALTHASNVLGTIFPIKKITKQAHKHNPQIKVVVDGAQSAPHIPVNVQGLGIDFFTFSGHKMLGPMGIGGLWIKKEHLELMEPFAVGGGMIHTVTKEKSSWAEAPFKFEAGTPNVAGAVGLAEAVKYLERIGMEDVQRHTQELTKFALKELEKVEDVEILGPKDVSKRTGLVSFVIKNVHAHDIAGVLDTKGIAIRAGQHCTAPLHTSLCIDTSARVSFQIYNTKREVKDFIKALKEGLDILK